MSYPKPHRISVKDTAKLLDLPDVMSLLKLRAACKRGALPCKCPNLRQGRFIVSEVEAFKIELDAIVTHAGNTQPTSPSPLDRRANTNRRQR